MSIETFQVPGAERQSPSLLGSCERIEIQQKVGTSRCNVGEGFQGEGDATLKTASGGEDE